MHHKCELFLYSKWAMELKKEKTGVDSRMGERFYTEKLPGGF
jgi:hypothetical protein